MVNAPSTNLAAALTAAFCAGAVSGAAVYAAVRRKQRQNVVETTKMLDSCDPESLRGPAADLTDLIIKYKQSLRVKEDKENPTYSVLAKTIPDSIKNALPNHAPTNPESYAAIFHDVETLILPNLTHWASPNFFAWFMARNCEPSLLADYLCSALNVIGFTWVSSPAATELEQVMLDWMAQLLGLPECFMSKTVGGGKIEGSASESAINALIGARDVALQGLEGQARADRAAKLVAYVSDQTHAIGQKGCMVLDIPHVRIIPTRRGAADDDNYGLHPDDVAAAMKKDLEAGLVPFFLIPTIGTTSSCAIDPIRALTKVARAQPVSVWVHVDGAFGGSACICPEYQHWLDGLEECNSICVNAHKWLMVGFDCSMFWVKDRRPLLHAFTLKPEYLKDHFPKQVNFKDWSMGLGRRFRSLKLWFTLRRYGVEKMRDHIRQSIEWTHRAEHQLMDDGRFKLFVPVRMALLCFCVEYGGRALSEALLDAVNATGKIFISHSVIDDVYFLRFSPGGLDVEEWHIDRAVKLIKDTLTTLTQGNPQWKHDYEVFSTKAITNA